MEVKGTKENKGIQETKKTGEEWQIVKNKKK
jgi:hypothetical protein